MSPSVRGGRQDRTDYRSLVPRRRDQRASAGCASRPRMEQPTTPRKLGPRTSSTLPMWRIGQRRIGRLYHAANRRRQINAAPHNHNSDMLAGSGTCTIARPNVLSPAPGEDSLFSM